jgi:hypothetical protein
VSGRNSDNKRVVLPLRREQASSSPKSAQPVPEPSRPSTITLDTIVKGGQEFYTPTHLDHLIQTTSLDTALSLARRLPEGTVKSILDKLPPDYLRNKLALSDLGLSPEELSNIKPSELIMALAKVGQGEIPQGGASVYFTTQVNQSDNSPIAATSLFSTKDHKVYACFKNEGALAKLDKVVVYWTNVTKGEVAYWGSQPIDPNTPYNYIWVEEKSGWATGSYLVAIFKNAKDTNCLAQGRFEVK